MATIHKVVLVTGCTTGGIGFHLCEQFAEQSCKVYATSRSVATMEGFKHPSIQKLALDVTNDEDFERVIKTILDAEGKVDIAISNAGVVRMLPIIDLPMDQVKHMFDTNTYSALRMAKAVIPSMAGRKSGLIVNVGSISADIPTPWNSFYSATKAALHVFTEVLQMECTPLNIDVMLVSPGAVRSNISNNGAAEFKLPPGSLYAAYLNSMLERLHLSQGKNAMPTEIFAKMVVGKCLQKKPATYFSAGGNATLFAILRWLPRAWVLGWVWRRFAKSN